MADHQPHAGASPENLDEIHHRQLAEDDQQDGQGHPVDEGGVGPFGQAPGEQHGDKAEHQAPPRPGSPVLPADTARAGSRQVPPPPPAAGRRPPSALPRPQTVPGRARRETACPPPHSPGERGWRRRPQRRWQRGWRRRTAPRKGDSPPKTPAPSMPAPQRRPPTGCGGTKKAYIRSRNIPSFPVFWPRGAFSPRSSIPHGEQKA